ncbi:MAG: RNA polymerase sigma factor [Myxococcota bacterium]
MRGTGSNPMGTDPDQEDVARAKAGDSLSMERLYRRHADLVYGYALRVLGRPDLAEDAAQETFIRAFRSIGRFDGRSSFKTWLVTIAINQSRTRRKQADRHGQSVPLEESHATSTDAEPGAPWTRRRLVEALGRLPDGYREAVIMHDVLEMEHEEIAEARGCSVGTSKSQLHKARIKLRGMLEAMRGSTDASST